MSNLYIEASVLFVEHFVDQEDINRQAGWQLEVIVTDCAPLFNTLKLGPERLPFLSFHKVHKYYRKSTKFSKLYRKMQPAECSLPILSLEDYIIVLSTQILLL